MCRGPHSWPSGGARRRGLSRPTALEGRLHRVSGLPASFRRQEKFPPPSNPEVTNPSPGATDNKAVTHGGTWKQTLLKVGGGAASDALEVIVREVRPRLVRYVSRCGAGAEDAEDIVQEALLRLHREMARGPLEGSLWAWLCCVAKHILIDAHRKSVRALTVPATAHAVVDPTGAVVTRIALTQVLAALPSRQAEALALKARSLSTDEIADAMAIAPGTVEQLLHRGRRALRAAWSSSPCVVPPTASETRCRTGGSARVFRSGSADSRALLADQEVGDAEVVKVGNGGGISLLVVSLLTGSAVAQPQEEEREWTVDYARLEGDLYQQWELENAYTTILGGTRLATGGCQFSAAGLTHPAEISAVVEQRYDIASCEMEVEVGEPSQEDVARFHSYSAGVPVGFAAEDSDGRTGMAAIAANEALLAERVLDGLTPDPPSAIEPGRRYALNVHSAWEEPARWAPCDPPAGNPDSDACNLVEALIPPVNSASTFLEWEPSRTCATAGGGFTMSTWDQLDRTGWMVDVAVHDGQGDCSVAHSKLHMVWRNDIFCAAIIGLIADLDDILIDVIPPLPEDTKIPTITRIFPQWSEGFATNDVPQWAVSSNPSKEGGCHEWLRYTSVREGPRQI